LQTNKEKLLEYVRANNRICPEPTAWNKLYGLLKNTKRKGGGCEPAAPLILAAWWEASAIQKMLRFIDHIEWADKNEQLEEIAQFIYALEENQWHHLGE